MRDTIDYINAYTDDFAPQVAIVLGSGLGEIANRYQEYSIPYDKIPGFPVSKVHGHDSKLVFANIEGKRVVMLQGRAHFYEGYSMDEITYPIKILKKLGVKSIIITNAAGAINKSFRPGDLMLITDHINFMGTSPLIGENDDSLGVRFPDMSEVYSKHLLKLADKAASLIKLPIKHGVYVATTGPNYETPAEIKMFRYLGADASGMSTVPEAIVANYCGMQVLGISCLSNYASGVSSNTLSHSEVLKVTSQIREKFINYILTIVKYI